MKISNKIFISYIVVFITILGMLFYPRFTFQPKKEVFFCGTPDFYPNKSFKTENLREGRKLFKILCASCHKLNKKLIGPALGNTALDFNYFVAYTRSRDSLVKTKHKRAVATTKEYVGLNYNHNFNQLNREQIKQVFEYCNLE